MGLMLLLPSISAITWNNTAYYKLDESSGAVIDATGIQNGVNYGATAGQTGKINTAYSFGYGDYINLTNNTGIVPTENFTISLWIYPTALPAGNGGGLVTKGSDVAGNDSYLLFIEGGALPRFVYYNQSGTIGSGLMATTNLVNNSWYHVLVKKSGTNATMWINGTKIDEEIYPLGSPRTSAIETMIGAYGAGVGTYYSFNGTIDEVGLWNRSLTDAEIAQLYNSGSGLAYTGGLQTITITLIHPPFGSLLTDTGSYFNATYNISSSAHTWKNATYNLFRNGISFNSTTVALSGRNNITSLFIDDFTIGDYIWNVKAWYGNASYNNFTTSSNYTYTVGASFQNVTYNSNIYETQSQTIYGNLTLVPGTQVYDVKLVYNGTEHPGVYTAMGDNTYILSSTFDTSKLLGTTASNMSFYLRIIYSTGPSSFLYENTSSLNQTVNPIILYSCSSASNRTLNFTAKDEENLTALTGWNFLGTFEYWIGGGSVRKNVSINNLSITSSALCISVANLTFKTDAIVQYEKAEYVKRNYYLYNASITNTTQNISLYLLASDSSTSFIVQVRDKSQLPVKEAYLYSQRYYPGTGNFETVAIGKTDLSGNTVLHFEDETEDYRIIVMKDGVILYTSAVQKVYCSATPCTLPIQTESGGIEGWTSFGNLSNLIYTGPYYDSTLQQVIYTYIDTSGTTSYGRLEVYNFVNSKKNVICNTNSTSSAATLTCDVSGIEGTIYSEAYLSRSPEALVWAKQFIINTIKAVMGLEGLFWALIVILVIAIAGALMGGVSGGVVGIVLGMWGVQLLQIASFGAITTWGVTGIGIFILWITNN